MTIKGFIVLRLKIQAARWLGITSNISEQELDAINQACIGEPDLRGILEDILKQKH